MSFSSEVKAELCQKDVAICCQKSFISAIIKTNSNLGISNQGMSINISFDNVSIIRYVFEIIKRLYNIESKIIVSTQMKFKAHKRYTLMIIDRDLLILNDLGIMNGYEIAPKIDKKLVKDECCLKSYLAGVFVAAGSVNAPETSNYHLEMQSSEEEYILELQKLLNRLNKRKYPLEINFKMVQRRKNYVLYLKSAQEIVDYLSYIGALRSTFTFEEIRIERDFINLINRANNMDLANEVKVVNAANKQLIDIIKIRDNLGINRLDPKLAVIAKLRMEHPDASLIELCTYHNENNIEKISKSGMNHRLRKLKQIASEINSRGD